jgi:membrane fusion protein (multidrug efflux system)
MKNIFNHSILIAACTLSMFSCSKNEDHKKPLANILKEVETARVSDMQPEKEIILPGDLKAWQEIKIYAKVKGFVKFVNVDRGSKVKKGHVLAILEAPEIHADRDEAKSKLFAAKANLEEEKARFTASQAVYNRLLETSKTPGAVSPNELDQAKAKMLTDSSRVLSAIENINSAQSYFNAKNELVEYLTVKAPFDGVISERNISAGALVGPDEASNTKPMYVLVDSDKLRLTVAIPEVYSSELIDGCKVSFKVSAHPERKFTACLARKSENLQEGIRSMMTEFDVDNKAQTLKAGTFTDVHIPIQRSSKTLFVHKTSVVNSQEKTFVITVQDSITNWVDVKTGNTIDTLVEVFGNLKAGDWVVKKASEEIRTGQKVKIVYKHNY